MIDFIANLFFICSITFALIFLIISSKNYINKLENKKKQKTP